MIDQRLIRDKTEEAVQAKLDSQTAFTTTDISNAVKQAVHASTQEVPGHRHIRPIIQELDANGDMAAADFVVSPITVYPLASAPITVRLWHPQGFDPVGYADVEQKPWMPSVGQTSDAAQQLDMSSDGPDDDDSMPVVTNTPSGATVTKQCQIQNCQTTLNLPSVLVKAAGFMRGDGVLIATNSKGGIDVKRAASSGTQTVDGEGRIRIHGKNLESLRKGKGDPCTAMLVEEVGVKYILIQ